MAALARSSNQPAAGNLREDPEGADPAADHWPVRSVVDTRPVRWLAPSRPVPLPRAPSWSPSLVAGQAPVPYLPARRRYRPVRLMAAGVVTLAVIGALGWLGHGRSAQLPAETAVVRVGAGETLWDIAQRVAPESDARAVVERIRRLNRIEGSAVQPGQQLWVPDGR